MDAGQAILISSRLVFAATAVFFSIVLWSKIRDTAWMFIVIGILAVYIEIIYSILGKFGIYGVNTMLIGSIPLAAILLRSLWMIFFIAAIIVMVKRQYRR
jgi:hypothetical protein